jgi:hypothetical protein
MSTKIKQTEEVVNAAKVATAQTLGNEFWAEVAALVEGEPAPKIEARPMTQKR